MKVTKNVFSTIAFFLLVGKPSLTYASIDAFLGEEGKLPPVSTISGYGNNKYNPKWGNAGQPFLRQGKVAYSDGISSPAGKNRPSARKISNVIFAQGDIETHDIRNMSAFIYTWGQFLDHDLDKSDTLKSSAFNILVPRGDIFFDPHNTGTQVINLNRSVYDPNTGTSKENPRQQTNQITSFLDGSMVYGSDDERSSALRTYKGGRLKSSPGNLLPLNNRTYFKKPLINDNNAHVVPDSTLFVSGDVRTNENVELAAVHTLFMREHNLWAKKISQKYPNLNDEQIFQYARAMVRAELQAITYNEWLPALIGKGKLPPYKGYNPKINPTIKSEFATAALRLGHTLLASDVEFIDNLGNEVQEAVNLREVFFNPKTINEVGIDPLLKYLASSNSSKADSLVVDDIRNFLFGKPGAGGLDLASLNIQRGRDHGIMNYNAARSAYHLAPVNDFNEITSDTKLQKKLKTLYGNVNNIDMWVGGLSEDYGQHTSIGPLFTAVLVDQFQRLRDGDRYWYEYIYSGKELNYFKKTKLADIIKRNTSINNLQDNVFMFNASISGKVYFDKSLNGLKPDRSLKDITVWLISENDEKEEEVVDTTKTDAQGRYAFHSIHETGLYHVKLQKKFKSTTPNPLEVQLSRGGELINNNFGVQLPFSSSPAISKK